MGALNSAERLDVGLVGMGVMGENLALNMEANGHSVAVYDVNLKKMRRFIGSRARERAIEGLETVEELVARLARPRIVFVLVPAGPPVDGVIGKLLPHLDKGDIIVDCGNSLYSDTARRFDFLEERGIELMGMGISGGARGALSGACLMPGGTESAYATIAPILLSICAHAEGPACTHVGARDAGHFVKMVHNGIEYADMQLIAEVYHLLKTSLGMAYDEIARLFTEWNDGPLGSYLIEITAKIFEKREARTGKILLDLVLDKAGQKGTGMWTSRAAMELGCPIPTISAAVSARNMSSLKRERQRAASLLPPGTSSACPSLEVTIEDLRDALMASRMITYAQGLALLATADEEHSYGLDLKELARTWKGGSIIRSKLLDVITDALTEAPALPNLLVNPHFASILVTLVPALRRAVGSAVAEGISYPAHASALGYYDSYRSARLPANLVQAQRDCFGSHTYERVDREGIFHSDWLGD